MTGEKRQVPEQTIRPESREHEELKRWTDDGDPGRVQGFADEWGKVGAGFTEAAEALSAALTASKAGWTGDAAEAMRFRLLGVVVHSANTGKEFTVANKQVTAQSESAESARRAMPEPVSYDPGQMIKDAQQGGLLEMALLPYAMPAQKEKHDAAHEKAVRVVAERDVALNGAAGSVPAFRAPQALIVDPTEDRRNGEHLSVGDDSGGSDAGRSSGPGGSGGQGGPGYPPGVPGGPPPASGPNAHPGTGSAADPGATQATTPGGYTPRDLDMVPVATNPGFGPGGSGPGPGGYVAGGGFGPGGGGGSAGGPGAGPGSGRGAAPVVAPGAAGAAEAAGRGGAGARGGMPMGGMPMGGRGKGDEDSERQRPTYLLEPDPDGTFGDDELVAPPVIGGPDDE